MKKILITGASGFLGVHLIEAIIRETDHEVIALTSRPEKLRQLMLRFILVNNNREEMVKDIAYINDHVHVYDTDGNNMVVKINPERILGLA